MPPSEALDLKKAVPHPEFGVRLVVGTKTRAFFLPESKKPVQTLALELVGFKTPRNRFLVMLGVRRTPVLKLKEWNPREGVRHLQLLSCYRHSGLVAVCSLCIYLQIAELVYRFHEDEKA